MTGGQDSAGTGLWNLSAPVSVWTRLTPCDGSFKKELRGDEVYHP